MLYDPKWEAPQTETEIEPWRKQLLQAADIIDKRGLAKGTQEDALGRVCVHGAISIVQHGRTFNDDPCEAIDKLKAYLRSNGSEEILKWDIGVARWNNAPERTQAEIVATLRRVAQL